MITIYIITHSNILSIVLGDNNEVRSAFKRMGSVFFFFGARRFNQFISVSGLCDLQMGGKKFTRMSKYGSKLSKIDRILVSREFVNKWPHAQLLALPREFSDHCPLILKSLPIDFRPTPFKFYNSWILHDDLSSLVKDSWSCNSNNPRLSPKSGRQFQK